MLFELVVEDLRRGEAAGGSPGGVLAPQRPA